MVLIHLLVATGIIQERVHSTSIGVEATSAFLQQLVQELEDATSEYLVPGVQALEHAQEVEMGTLITASSLVRLPLSLLLLIVQLHLHRLD